MLSAFEIIGPAMVGPSSSHTAGACRIGWLARGVLGETPTRVLIGLHGSFEATGQGHGTDRALVAGLMGMAPDDERIKNAPALAKEAGLSVEFQAIDLGEVAHPNSARIEMWGASEHHYVVAASVGGGSVVLNCIDDYVVEIPGRLETAILWHQDAPGFLGSIATICGAVDLNIASMRTSRQVRGQGALTALEVDGTFQDDILSLLRRSRGVQRLIRLPVLPGS